MGLAEIIGCLLRYLFTHGSSANKLHVVSNDALFAKVGAFSKEAKKNNMSQKNNILNSQNCVFVLHFICRAALK